MFFKSIFIAAGLALCAGQLGAQALTPEELLAQVDKRVAAQNPYQALLNDPDPARSLAAIEIMLQSGDASLIRMATEFGLFSPNATVQRIALEGILATKPVLTPRLDGSVTENASFSQVVSNTLGGTVTPEKIGYFQIALGEFNDELSCFAHRKFDRCAVTVNSEGVFVTAPDARHMRGLFALNEDGTLTGSATIYGVDTPVPATISLID